MKKHIYNFCYSLNSKAYIYCDLKTTNLQTFLSKYFLLCSLFLFSFLKVSANEPLTYVANLGQWEDHILFKASLGGGYLFAEQNKITFVVSEEGQLHHHELEASHQHNHLPHQKTQKEVLGKFAYQLEFVNSNEDAIINGQEKQTAYHNYFLSNDQNKWRGEVPLYQKVMYEDIYENIDLALYGKDYLFEYDFIVRPGGDVDQIRLKYTGIKSIKIRNGQLHLPTPMGTMVELAPVVYQEINGKRKQIRANFTLKSNHEVGFEILEDYDKSKPLIIDPILVFSTYSGSSSDNWGFTATYDNDGNLFAGGMTTDQGYPATIGAYDTIYSGGGFGQPTDIVVSKYSPDGRQLLFATYIGGSDNEIPHSLICTEQNELLIYGSTGSADYPVTQNAYDKSFNGGPQTSVSTGIDYSNGSDIIITKLNVSGSNLLGSTYFGGNDNDGINISSNNSLEYNYGDLARGDIAVAANSDIIISSCTYSEDIPNTSTSFQPLKDASQSSIIARFSSDLSTLDWASYFGGNGDDAAYSLELFDNEIIVGGGTNSDDLSSMNGLNSTYQGGQADGYVLKISADGTTTTAGTYLGTSEYDQAYFIDVDADGNIYALGQTIGAYDISSNVYSVQNATQFIQELSNDLSQNNYATVFGSPYSNNEIRKVNISPTAFLVDNCKNIYAIGWGGSVNELRNEDAGFTFDMATTPDAFLDSTDGSDFYLIVIEQGTRDLLYASYFGEFGNTGDHVDGGTSRFDKDGFVYHASCASCSGSQGFPVTDSVWSESNNSNNCNTAAFKFEFEFAPIVAATDADPISGCPPLTIQFSNFSNIVGEYYFWDFDDGSSAQVENPIHVFTEPGIYDVEFVIIDSNNCKLSDTAMVQIFVSDTINETAAEFIIADSQCSRTNIFFDNQSINANNYLWDFGDGITSTDEDPLHDYLATGTYLVTLIADPGSGCSDTIQKPVTVFDNTLNSNFNFEQPNCSNTTAVIQFTDSSFGDFTIVEWLWNFGDGTTSTDQNPIHTYSSDSIYDVTLTVTDDVGCSAFINQTVGISTTLFTADFNTVSDCDPITFGTQFIDASGPVTNVVSWEWEFGDGSISSIEEPLHFYQNIGSYDVQLIVTNDLGCSDTIVKSIDVDTTQIDVSFEVVDQSCNDPVFVFNNTTTSEDSIVSWFWDFGDGFTSTEENPTHEYTNLNGSFIISLTATTLGGCASNSLIFTNVPILDVDFTIITPPGCSTVNQPYDFTIGGASSSNVDTTIWDFGDGSPLEFGFNVSHTYTMPGTYEVVYLITNAEGCRDTTIKTIIVSDSVIIDITAEPIACGSLTVDFDADISSMDTITSITWDLGDGTVLQDSINFEYTYATAGNYNIQVNVQTSAGCTGSNTYSLELSLVDLTADFDIANEGCNPLAIELTNQTTSSDTSLTYNWDFGDGISSNDVNPNHVYPDSGTYMISLISTTVDGCIDSISIPITVTQNFITVSDAQELCVGDSVQLSVAGNFGATYNWTPSIGLNNDSSSQPIASPTVTTTYYATAIEINTNGDTCTLTDSILVTVNDLPTVVATADAYQVIAGTEVNLEATAGFDTYTWSPSATISDPTISDPSATINNDIIFEVVVIDENGCSASDTVGLVLIEESDSCQLESLFIPTAFTPNGDGQNDVLFVQLLGNYDRLDFRIHNRWGELVFSSDDINLGWSGEYSGQLQSTDVFGYILEIECEGEIIQRQGNITLVR